MNLDPRDRILQDHAPAVMVPRFGQLPAADRIGHRYLVAQDGLWLEVTRPWLLARVPLPQYGEDAAGLPHPLPFGKVESTISYNLDVGQYEHVRARFLADALRAMPNEFAAWGIYDARTRELTYQPLVAIEASAGGITFHRPDLAEGQHLAIDLHSHGKMGPFFSATDDADDCGEVKIAIVVGNLDQPEPAWTSRLCLLGIFIADSDHSEVTPDGTCRVCGCTDLQACPGGCAWVEPNLCSNCVTELPA